MLSLFVGRDLVQLRIDHLEGRLLDVGHEVSDHISNMLEDLTEELHRCLSYRWGGVTSGQLGVVDGLLERGS